MGDQDNGGLETIIPVSEDSDNIPVFNLSIVRSSLEDASTTLYDLLTSFQNILERTRLFSPNYDTLFDEPKTRENMTKIYRPEHVNNAIRILKKGSFSSPSPQYSSKLLALNDIYRLQHMSNDPLYEKAASLMEEVGEELKIEQNPSEYEQNTLFHSLLSNKWNLLAESITLGLKATDNLETSAYPYHLMIDVVDNYLSARDKHDTEGKTKFVDLKNILDQTVKFYNGRDEMLAVNMGLVIQSIMMNVIYSGNFRE